MADDTSLNGVRREERAMLNRSVNAGFLRRWDLHDPGGPERSERRTPRQPAESRRPKQAAVR
jgi:hypothetical protein